MAPKPTHGVRRDARLLRVTRSRGDHRIADSKRRAIARYQQRLDAEPLATLRDGLIVSITNGRYLLEQADAALMASSDLGAQTGLAKFAGWLGNRVRRDSELLLVIEEKLSADRTAVTMCGKCGRAFSGADYLNASVHACVSNPPATPPASPIAAGSTGTAAGGPASDDDSEDT